MPKILYVCELCEKEFSDWDECWTHEEAHIKPVAYGVKPFNYLPPNHLSHGEDPQPYPFNVRVPMNDGALIQYTFDQVITPAPPSREDSDE